jgi:hypothetical protein
MFELYGRVIYLRKIVLDSTYDDYFYFRTEIYRVKLVRTINKYLQNLVYNICALFTPMKNPTT